LFYSLVKFNSLFSGWFMCINYFDTCSFA